VPLMVLQRPPGRQLCGRAGHCRSIRGVILEGGRSEIVTILPVSKKPTVWTTPP
jgi:hypothetical protein